MSSQVKVDLDAVDWRLLEELQGDSRLSHAELGRRVHLTPPAVAARIRRLEDQGVIRGYRLDLGLEALGWDVLAFVRVRSQPTRSRPLTEMVRASPHVLECHHVTGDDCFVVKVAARSMPDLERLVEELGRYGATTTSIVFSAPVTHRTFGARDCPAPEAPPRRAVRRNGG
jgi:Lrp/AsnC family transcriptional regulator, leucine-responsive regulatory protein